MIYGHGFRIFIMKFLGCASDGGKQAHGARGRVGLGVCLFCLTREGHGCGPSLA